MNPVFSIQDTVASTEVDTEKSIRIIAERLKNYKTVRKAANELTELSASDQAALQPLIKLYTDKNSDKGTTHEVLHLVFLYMKKYFKKNRASQETIESLIDSISNCIEEKKVWGRRLPHIMIEVSKNSTLMGEQIDRLVLAAKRDQEINKYRLHPADAAVPILKAISFQGKYHIFDKNVRELAKKYIESTHGQTQITGMLIFSSQLHFNDKESLAVVHNILDKAANRSLSYRTITEYVKNLKNKKNADGEILQLTKLYQSHETNRSNHSRIFKPLLENPYITEVTRAKIFAITTDSTQAESDYLKLLSIKKQVDKNNIDDTKIEFIISLYPKYLGQDLSNQAMDLLAVVKGKQGLSPVIHHKLIELLTNTSNLNGNNAFRKFVMESIPFAYYEGNSNNKYDSKLIESIINKIKSISSREKGYLINILKNISRHQVFSQKNTNRLYLLFPSFTNQAYKAATTEIIANHYNKNAYMDMAAVETLIKQHAMTDTKLLNIFFVEITRRQKPDPRQILLDYYLSSYLPDTTRRIALNSLIKYDFDFAQANALPPYVLDSQRMKQTVWSLFIENSKRNKLILDKQKLKDATKDQDAVIQRLAWEELERSHGESIPLVRQIKHPYYSKVLKYNLLTIASLVSIIVSFFLYMGGSTKHDSNLWRITQVSLWILATLAFVVLSIGGILLSGLSHSGYPYSETSDYLIYTNSVYLGAGLLLRILTTVYIKTRHIKDQSNKQKNSLIVLV